MKEWQAFSTTVPGKWVLAGEHAVLRGATAVALPHPEFKLQLEYDPDCASGVAPLLSPGNFSNVGNLRVDPASAQRVVVDLLGSVQVRWPAQGRSFTFPTGCLRISSSIPVSAGLGSSSALCVAMAQWLAAPLGLKPDDLLGFATALEHRFHGQSSGMDVAAALSGQPISFVRGQMPRALGVKNLPRFTFHDSGLRSCTSDCVAQVSRLLEEAPLRAEQIDNRMRAASQAAMDGLIRFDQGDKTAGLEKIAQGMRAGQECYRDWQLLPPEVATLQEELLGRGALAVKLTGAGGGGFLVALWAELKWLR